MNNQIKTRLKITMKKENASLMIASPGPKNLKRKRGIRAFSAPVSNRLRLLSSFQLHKRTGPRRTSSINRQSRSMIRYDLLCSLSQAEMLNLQLSSNKVACSDIVTLIGK